MTHSKEYQIYKILLQYISFAKELEFFLRTEYTLSKDNIVRCFVEKRMPQQGILMHEGKQYTWRFHGSGITYESDEIRFHYNTFPENAFGVIFASVGVRDFIQYKKMEVSCTLQELDDIFLTLSQQNLLLRIWPDHHE